MASLVSWLAYSGARKVDGTPVASGSAYFYQPDTTNTQVTVYSDEDGLIAVTQPVTLDASGRAAVYTRVPCRVAVLDAAGASVQLQDRANTVTAAQVEIENAVATGTDLTTGSQVAGGRTDLNTFLSNLLDSFGAPDGQVMVGGSAQNLQDAIGASASLFYNVKSTSYGAVGNDSAEDSGAIQAAVDAAQNAGGGVVVIPPGTYKVSTTISVTGSKVRVMGLGTPGSVILKSYTASTAVFTVTGTDFYVENVAFAMGAASAYLLSFGSGATGARIVGCAFTLGSATGAGILTTATTSRVVAVGCTFLQSLATGSMFSVNASSNIQVLGGHVTIPTANSTYVVLGGAAGAVQFSGTHFNHTAASGTTSLVQNTAGLVATFAGCVFQATGGGTLQLSGGASSVVESGCYLGSNNNVRSVLYSTWRNGSFVRTTGAGTTYTPDAVLYQYHEVETTAVSMQFNPPTVPSLTSAQGLFLVIRFKNNNAGAITPVFDNGAGGYRMGTIASVASTQSSVWLLAYDANNALWYQVAGNSSAITS